MGQPTSPMTSGQPPMGYLPPTASPGGSSGRRVLGTVLLALGVLPLLGAAFFGYFSYSNAGAAERLGSEFPEARFITRQIEAKAKSQMTLALVLGVAGVVLFGGGIALRASAKKSQLALGGGTSPAGYGGPGAPGAPGAGPGGSLGGYGTPQGGYGGPEGGYGGPQGGYGGPQGGYGGPQGGYGGPQGGQGGPPPGYGGGPPPGQGGPPPGYG